MKISEIINDYYDAYLAKFKDKILPSHIKALNSMRRCRTAESGEVYMRCPDCEHSEWRPLSCGHRNCPQCQNHETSTWIDRQIQKLLPVQYFMVTFTLPYEFRSVTYENQQKVFPIMFSCVSTTLADFGLNPKHLGASIGMTMALHTHSRNLNYHPHMHVIVPGGGIDENRKQWKKIKGEYLFNQNALAKVFRARFLDALNKEKLSVPKGIRPKWVVDCKHVGNGSKALLYLSRYLYRGVISEKNIIANHNGYVTFKYTESKTGNTCYRTLKGENFLNLILRHVLPKGFRRVRDYGFLHSNSKKLLFLVQIVLHMRIKPIEIRKKPAFKCPRCKAQMVAMGIRITGLKPG